MDGCSLGGSQMPGRKPRDPNHSREFFRCQICPENIEVFGQFGKINHDRKYHPGQDATHWEGTGRYKPVSEPPPEPEAIAAAPPPNSQNGNGHAPPPEHNDDAEERAARIMAELFGGIDTSGIGTFSLNLEDQYEIDPGTQQKVPRNVWTPVPVSPDIFPFYLVAQRNGWYEGDGSFAAFVNSILYTHLNVCADLAVVIVQKSQLARAVGSK